MFAWSRTWYAEKDGVIYNFDMKKQRDELCNKHGFNLVTAKDAYGMYGNLVKVPWQNYESFKKRIGIET